MYSLSAEFRILLHKRPYSFNSHAFIFSDHYTSKKKYKIYLILKVTHNYEKFGKYKHVGDNKLFREL